MEPTFYDATENRFRTSIHSWLLRTPNCIVLIDTCVGNHKQRPQVPRFHMCDTPWLSRLAEAGIQPEDVDYVMCTHLHCDHVGWNTRLSNGKWVPTFPNARYLFGRKEFDRWDARRADYQHRHINDHVFNDSILPVVEAGQMMLVDDGYELDGVLTVEPAPGHTAGHVCIRVASGGKRAYCSGDIFHHPLQIHHPQLYTGFDDDPDGGVRTRLRLLSACADENAILLPAHFAEPHACFVRRSGSGYVADFGGFDVPNQLGGDTHTIDSGVIS
ncbi:MBL fold metallo-hydrolase [Pusillimonas sp. MFBS29]|nr:MBL fold metallo-hydrolase [Pusillimonas sp. MFBS29]MCC2595864.1 MBL fold metallo-hydrolase [Pusillimonas sp. MFBS29]